MRCHTNNIIATPLPSHYTPQHLIPFFFFFFQAEDGIRDRNVTGVQTCALPICYRAIVPYLRGYGTTRFLSSETFRNGQQSAVALDIIALMDALRIEKAIVAGFDWGSRTAAIIAALWPERCKALVAVSGYLDRKS